MYCNLLNGPDNYPTEADAVQITVLIYSDICTVENLFAAQVSTHVENCYTLLLSLINLLTTQLDNKSLSRCFVL